MAKVSVVPIQKSLPLHSHPQFFLYLMVEDLIAGAAGTKCYSLGGWDNRNVFSFRKVWRMEDQDQDGSSLVLGRL